MKLFIYVIIDKLRVQQSSGENFQFLIRLLDFLYSFMKIMSFSSSIKINERGIPYYNGLCP